MPVMQSNEHLGLNYAHVQTQKAHFEEIESQMKKIESYLKDQYDTKDGILLQHKKVMSEAVDPTLLRVKQKSKYQKSPS